MRHHCAALFYCLYRAIIIRARVTYSALNYAGLELENLPEALERLGKIIKE